jgi:hypothetical protein
MKTIVIPWINDERPGAKAQRALEMNLWCRKQGLKSNTDYDWYYEPAFKCTKFRFYGNSESVATMFALRWVGDEVQK